jgi:indolepyruvate ferredoxin oxidoreductase, beta subunit
MTGAPLPPRAVTILICALGGEGGGVLSEWLVNAALNAGYPVQSTSIPGVAQRTGSTTYYVEMFPIPNALLAGKQPVFSLNPVPGAIDLLVSTELLETVRHICAGMSSLERTMVLSSSSRTLTTRERLQMGDGRIPSDPLLEVLRLNSESQQVFDMAAVAREANTVVSAVMFGAIAASGKLPIDRDALRSVIAADGRGAQSLRGFDAAYTIVKKSMLEGQPVRREATKNRSTHEQDGPALSDEFAELRYPEPLRETVRLGYLRVLDYQDRRYGELYLKRVDRILAIEKASPSPLAAQCQTTREYARYLALWMAFDDIVRVADLKCRKSRLERVRGEVKAVAGEQLRIYDHFKPGMPEFAALLPEALARVLTRWDRRRQSKGAEPFAIAMKIPAHAILGMAALRMLSGMRWLRRQGTRFKDEQALIERWSDAIATASANHWRQGHELALCGRLIKGYGATNERGKENLLHIVQHLAATTSFANEDERADAIREARIAALADENGTAFDRALTSRGAPTKVMKEIPVRFVRPRKSADPARATTA